MIITSEFKVDLFQLKHTSDPTALLAAIINANAAELGRKIIAQLPYEKDVLRSFSGELPEMSANKEHQYFDLYSRQLIIISKEQLDEINEMKQSAPELAPVINKIIELLNSKQ